MRDPTKTYRLTDVSLYKTPVTQDYVVPDFVAVPLTYIISGTAKDRQGQILSGVTVTFSGSKSATATTDAAGAYSFTVPAEGDYTVTPAARHYAFAPASAAFAHLGGEQAADFAATLNLHTVSGRVADANGAGMQGATVTLSGAVRRGTGSTAGPAARPTPASAKRSSAS